MYEAVRLFWWVCLGLAWCVIAPALAVGWLWRQLTGKPRPV